MHFRLGGYRPSVGEINCSKFRIDKFVKMASSQNNIHIIPEFTPISNQGIIGSCTANATADAFEMLKGLEDPAKVEQVSRLFIYYNARVYSNDTNSDSGCYIHDALDSLKKLGACRESTWQYDTSKVFIKPTLESYKEGNDNTIETFYQIGETGENRLKQIETAIRANHPVIFGTSVGKEFLEYTGDNKVFDPPKDSMGGHAMLITGIRTINGVREFFIRNSWGEGWGNKGHCWFSSDYINWASTHDFFVPTRMIDFIV